MFKKNKRCTCAAESHDGYCISAAVMGVTSHVKTQSSPDKIKNALISPSAQIRQMKDGQHFLSNETIIAAVKKRVTSATVNFYSMQSVVHHQYKSIANGDNYGKNNIW